MRIAPTCTPVKSSSPLMSKSPRLIKMNELPQMIAKPMRVSHCFAFAKILKKYAQNYAMRWW